MRAVMRTGIVSTVLLLSLLPAVGFVGHWPLRIDIPFTDYYWGLPANYHADHGHHDEQDHTAHCHGEVSCTVKPVLSGAGFALVSEVLLLLGAAGIARRSAVPCWRPALEHDVLPELEPPRGGRRDAGVIRDARAIAG